MIKLTNTDKLSVLIVEDEALARQQLAKFVRRQGYVVIEACNGKEGWEKFQEEAPSVVISDIKMPELDGMQLLKKIHDTDPEVQFVVVTAYGTTDTVIKAIREGAIDFIKKPIDLDQLSLALGRAENKLQQQSEFTSYPTILLAEDEETTRSQLASVLEEEPWEVLTAKDGIEALSIFRDQKVDIVLLDIRMPEQSGLESLREMTAITDDFEAVILTGYGDEDNATEALRMGANNFLRKPIDLDQLIVAIKKALEQLNTERALRYRTRELELTREIIARITREKEVIIDARDQTQPAARQFAQRLIDTVPGGVVVVDKDLNLVYINNNLKEVAEKLPERLNEEFISSWQKLGVKGLDYDAFLETVREHFKTAPGEVQSVKAGEYAHIYLITVKVLTEQGESKHVIITLRGERK